MRKPSKSESVLIGLMIGAVCVTMALDANLKGRKNQNRNLRSQNRAQATELAQTQVKTPGYLPGRMKAGTVADYWGLDPFDRMFTRDAVAVDGGVLTPRDDRIELNGVMISSRGGAAIINKQVYRVGDTVGRFVVDSISRTEVVVRSVFDGTTIRLKVE